jgi:hypothetical protein
MAKAILDLPIEFEFSSAAGGANVGSHLNRGECCTGSADSPVKDTNGRKTGELSPFCKSETLARSAERQRTTSVSAEKRHPSRGGANRCLIQPSVSAP